MNIFDRIFKRQVERPAPVQRPDLADTAPLRADTVIGRLGQSAIRTLTAGSAQSSGLERDNNEDSLLVLYGSMFGQQVLQGFGLFCIADGAGGHGYGEVASAVAVRAVADSLLAGDRAEALWGDLKSDRPPLDKLVHGAMQDANREVLEHGEGGFTTLTLAVVMGGRVVLGHAGDSRAYRLSEGSLQLLTRDHSMAQRLVEVGQIEAHEARTHAQRSTLWNAIGQREEPVIEIGTHDMPRGSYLLLCSDGLWGEVEEARMGELILDAPDPTSACKALIRAANEAGGPDNISAVLVAFP